MRTIRTFLVSLVFAAIFAAILVPAAARAAEDVDLLLVLAVDVSRSIDASKFQLQREGYAAAVADPHVLDAIRTGRTGRIGLTFVEWSGVGSSSPYPRNFRSESESAVRQAIPRSESKPSK